jgi:Tat protein translocase TatB subunit
MFSSIGMGELIIIMGLALVIMGPEKFPEFAKIIVRTIRDVKTYVSETKTDIAKELRPVQKELRDLSRMDPETYIDALARSDAPDKEKKQKTAGETLEQTETDANNASNQPPGTSPDTQPAQRPEEPPLNGPAQELDDDPYHLKEYRDD